MAKAMKKAKNLRQSKPAVGATEDWHHKIAKSRGEKWRKNMLAGRREAQLSPSRIRLLRLKFKIEQRELARLVDVSVSTFGAIERGKQKVKKDVAEVIAKQLKTSVNKIFMPTPKNKYIAVLQKPAV